jgi:hypothetical protein
MTHLLDVAQQFHRAGWSYATSSLPDYNGIILDLFADETFLWRARRGRLRGVIPYRQPWYGFFHHTPLESYTANNLTVLRNPKNPRDHKRSSLFRESLSTCQGILVLSECLGHWFREWVNVPVYVLYHPTILTRPLYTFTDFKVVNVGAWYRNPWTIHLLPFIYKYSLRGKAMENYFMPPHFIIDSSFANHQDNHWVRFFYQWLNEEIKRGEQNELSGLGKFPKFRINTDDYSYYPKTAEIRNLTDKIRHYIASVNRIEWLTNEEYDHLLSSSIIFLHLMDASAVNTIIECIASATPLMVNRHPAVIEYLGKDYPLYYDDPAEIDLSFLSRERVMMAHNYLLHKDKTFLDRETFRNSLDDIIKKNLPLDKPTMSAEKSHEDEKRLLGEVVNEVVSEVVNEVSAPVDDVKLSPPAESKPRKSKKYPFRIGLGKASCSNNEEDGDYVILISDFNAKIFGNLKIRRCDLEIEFNDLYIELSASDIEIDPDGPIGCR